MTPSPNIARALLILALSLLCLTPSNSVAATNDQALASPVYALWNGFLSMTNVLELVNKDETELSVTISVYDISGAQVNTFTEVVSSLSQKDIVLNTTQGFSADSYGSIKLVFTGSLDGRISFYRQSSAENSAEVGQYEFAYSVPFCNALSSSSFVPFNTFQPSTNPVDADFMVLNWLSIFNQHSSETKTFTVNRYDQNGVLLVTEELNIAPLQRKDIDGGHGTGASVVGLNEIIPTDTSAPYQAQLVRFGSMSPTGSSTSYSWAFPLSPVSGSSSTIWSPISSGAGAQNWVELVNVSNSEASVRINLYDNSGNELSGSAQTRSIPAYSQLHLDASALLPAGASGAVEINPLSGEVIGNSMFYFRDSVGSINAMYGSAARGSSSGTQNGSWNLFLNQLSWLRVFNTGSDSEEITVSVRNGESLNTQTYTLAAHSGTDLGLHDTSTFGTSSNSFGVVTLSGQNVISDILRLRNVDSESDLDYVFPTAVSCCGTEPTEEDPPTQARIPIGWNVSWIAPWASHMVFVDAFKRSMEWIPVRSDFQGWDTGSTVPTGDTGYPTQVPFNADSLEQVAVTFFYTDMNGNYPSGTYTLEFEGSGSMFISVGDDDYGPYTTAGTYQVPITAHTGGIYLWLTQSSASDPIRNIRFIQPGHENTHLTNPFHSSFIDSIGDVSVLRFAQPLSMNGGTYRCDNNVAVTDPTCSSAFANRTTMNHQTQAASRGMAWEYAIDICNEVGADLWASVIHHASDDYVRSIAELIRDRLNSNLRVYIEWSNEPWAPGHEMFPQAEYVQNIGVQQFPADSAQPFTAGLKYQARRSAQVYRIFDEVFAGQEDRLTHVMAGWMGMSTVSDQLMSYLDDSSINTAGVDADMLVVGAYFGTHLPGWVLANNLEDSLSVSSLLDRVESSLTTATEDDESLLEPSYTTYVRNQKTVADNYNVPLGTYEAGQHLAELRNFDNNSSLSALILGANRHSRMYGIYNQFMDIWYQESGQGLMVPYSLIHNYSLPNEAFGHRETWNQPLSEAHKYRAVLERAQSLRQAAE